MKVAKIPKSIITFDSRNVSFTVYINTFPSTYCSFQRFPEDVLLFPYEN